MKDFCHRCLDAGVVEAIQGSFKTLALCFCKQGRRQPWALEMIPLKGFRDEPLSPSEYKSKDKAHKQELITWHIERVRNAEQFWAKGGE